MQAPLLDPPCLRFSCPPVPWGQKRRLDGHCPSALTVEVLLGVHAELATLQQGTLHVILTEDHDSALLLSASAQHRLPQATAVIAGQTQVHDLMDEVHAGAGNSRAVTAAVIAQMASMDAALAESGFGSVSVLVQRTHMAPVRCGFWRASASSPKLQPQAPTHSQTPSEAQMQPGLNAAGPLGSDGHSSEGRKSTSMESSEGNAPLHRRASDRKPPKHSPSLSPSNSSSSMTANFIPDVLLAAVEPFGAQVLELQKLDGFRGKIGYSPTRNRQCHMYTIVERPNQRCAPLKRVLLRCEALLHQQAVKTVTPVFC